MKKYFTRIILVFIIAIYDISHRLVSRLSIVAEGGLHPKHRLMGYHHFFVNNIYPCDTVLDIGCSNGSVTYDIAQKAKKVTAIDLNPKSIDFAKKHFHRNNIDYVFGDATTFEFGSKFDVIILSNVLEHIDNRIEFLRKIRKLSDRFLIRVPCINRDWLTYYKRELGLFYFLDRSHNVEYTLDSLNNELAEVGMKIKSASIQFGEIWATVQK